MARTISLSNIAEETGYSTATVSMALRGGLGKVKPETCKLIQEAADRLGYRPNSPAAMLALQRHHPSREAQSMVLACVGVARNTRHMWESFASAAENLGMQAIPVFEPADGETAELQLRQLWDRGVTGIFLLPLSYRVPEAELIGLDWDRFAVVKRTRAMSRLPFHTLRLSSFDYMLETLERVFAAGHRRIAVVLSNSLSASDDMARLGAVLAFRKSVMPADGFLEYLETDFLMSNPRKEVDDVVSWIHSIEPTAVLVFPNGWCERLIESGLRTPEEVSLASVFAYPEASTNHSVAGCDPADTEMGQMAVEWLFKLVQGGEFGFMKKPQEVVIRPRWIEGDTLRPLMRLAPVGK